MILHILAKEEIDVELSGTFFLIDAENKDDRLRVTMESSAIRSYKEALDEFTGELKRSAKKCGASYHLCSTGVGFDKIIFEELKDIYEF